MNGLKVKPTAYNGYFFRSRLEARWAVFFDLAGIKYIYEPETYICENGEQYTPDFYLYESYCRCKEDKGVFLEIKPVNYNLKDYLGRQDYEKRIGSAIQPKPLILICGDPVDAIVEIDRCDLEKYAQNENYQLSPWWDDCMRFMYCNSCFTLKLEYNEGNYYECPKCRNAIRGTELNSYATKSRQYRFKYFELINNIGVKAGIPTFRVPEPGE